MKFSLRGLQQTQLRYILNEEYRQFSTKKKKKKRSVIVRNVLYREIYKKIQNLNLDAEDGTLDQNNAKKYKSLVKDLCKVKQLAKIIVKRDTDGSDYNFQCWVKSHLNSCPEDNSVLKSYLRGGDTIPLIEIDQLLQSLEDKPVEKNVVKAMQKNKPKKKGGSKSPGSAAPKAKKQKRTGVVMDSLVSKEPKSPNLTDARVNDQSPKLNSTTDMTGKSLTKRKLHFAGDYHEKTQKFTFSDDDFLFENQPSQEVVTLQPIDDSFDEYEQNLGKNQVPDEDENQQDYRLTTL